MGIYHSGSINYGIIITEPPWLDEDNEHYDEEEDYPDFDEWTEKTANGKDLLKCSIIDAAYYDAPVEDRSYCLSAWGKGANTGEFCEVGELPNFKELDQHLKTACDILGLPYKQPQLIVGCDCH